MPNECHIRTGQMRRKYLTAADRGISQEKMAALAFGLTVLMMAIVGGLLMQSGDSLTGGGPIMSTSAETVHASGSDAQWVRVKHTDGDTVAVKNLDIVVELPDHGKRARLHDLPTDRLLQEDYRGNHIFTRGSRHIEGPIYASDGSDGKWEAGDTVGFRIEQRRVDLEPGDRINVTFRHTKSGTVLSEERLEVSR